MQPIQSEDSSFVARNMRRGSLAQYFLILLVTVVAIVAGSVIPGLIDPNITSELQAQIVVTTLILGFIFVSAMTFFMFRFWFAMSIVSIMLVLLGATKFIVGA